MLFIVTIFLSAFLLFQVQPFIAKVILPYYGGSATVWTSCMLFFQSVLLAGYAYAHGLQKLTFSRQKQLHLLLLAIACVALPFSTPEVSAGAIDSQSTLSILTTLMVSVGLPYFVLSSTGPLVQSWFAQSRQDKIPYKLYAISNTGSLLALVSYPFLFEPILSLGQQTLMWSSGFIAFALLIAALLLTLNQQPDAGGEQNASHSKEATEVETPTMVKLGLWLALSALGVSALVSTTNAMTQNVAPMPFLWVLPLALYLVTFIIAFHKPNLYVRWYWLVFFILSAFMATFMQAVGSQFDFVSQVLMYSFILFSACMICHGELYQLSPDAKHLTLYYLMIALGGVLGSAFVSLLAPTLFNDFSEYPITLIAILVVFTINLSADGKAETASGFVSNKLVRTSLYGCALLISLLNWQLSQVLSQHQIASERNFYGLLSVVDTEVNGKAERRLIDGTTSHGTQSLVEGQGHIAKSYYRADTGVALALENYLPISAMAAKQSLNVGLIGLGAGTLATYGRPGDNYHFFELNPAVADFAEQYFTYLSDSPANIKVTIGDGRQQLQRAFDNKGSLQFDVLVLDAFSGDAIPAHLLTLEAFALYEAHLKTNGILAVHISNSHLDLASLTRNLANSINREALYVYTASSADEPNEAQWVLITNNTEFSKRYAVKKHISPWPDSSTPDVIWRDDFSNLLSVLK